MKNIRIFYLKICHFLVVKFSVYLNRRVFVMALNTDKNRYSGSISDSKIEHRTEMVAPKACLFDDMFSYRGLCMRLRLQAYRKTQAVLYLKKKKKKKDKKKKKKKKKKKNAIDKFSRRQTDDCFIS